MFRIMMVVVIAALNCNLYAASLDEVILQRAAEAFKKNENFSDYTVKADTTALSVEFKMRKFTVHGQDRVGNWDTATYDKMGPDVDGFQFRVQVWEHHDRSPLLRSPVKVISKQGALREPYFYVVYSTSEFKEENLGININIFFGEKVDMEKLNKVYDALKETFHQVCVAAHKEIERK